MLQNGGVDPAVVCGEEQIVVVEVAQVRPLSGESLGYRCTENEKRSGGAVVGAAAGVAPGPAPKPGLGHDHHIAVLPLFLQVLVEGAGPLREGLKQGRLLIQLGTVGIEPADGDVSHLDFKVTHDGFGEQL